MFHRCKTEQDGKELFKKLSKLLHPDCGGDHEAFILLKEAHELYKERRNEHSPKHAASANRGAGASWPGAGGTRWEKIKTGDKRLDILDKIYKFAEANPNFNTGFVDSVKCFLDKTNFISTKQYETLCNIVEKWKI